jgi:hypothetical protein
VSIPPQPRDLTLAQQFINLKMNPLTRGTGSIANGRLSWQFNARPSPISRSYAMRLTYAVGDSPEFFVEDPDLVILAGGLPLPHVYSEKPTRLCLHLPGTSEWSPGMLLDRTVAPWAVLWLWYFEDWLATGEWHGGGIHPSDHDADGGVERRRVRRGLAALQRSTTK